MQQYLVKVALRHGRGFPNNGHIRFVDSVEDNFAGLMSRSHDRRYRRPFWAHRAFSCMHVYFNPQF
ncbi:hypothetical protein ACVILH_002139 [Bradyrhizobium sp. USDA 4353]